MTYRRQDLIDIKMHAIRSINFICRGCRDNHSDKSVEELLKIFTMGHVHSNYCNFRVRGNNNWHWICKRCNTKQGTRCGYYQDGKLIEDPACAERRTEELGEHPYVIRDWF